MTTAQIRAELAEIINGGNLKVTKIVSYFKQHRPTADLNTVKTEAKELVAEVKAIIKRGY